MSHCYGAICERHHEIMVMDTCPERGCFGAHGFIPQPCAPPCSRHVPASEPAAATENGARDER